LRKRVDPSKLYYLHFDPVKQIVVDNTAQAREELREAMFPN